MKRYGTKKVVDEVSFEIPKGKDDFFIGAKRGRENLQ